MDVLRQEIGAVYSFDEMQEVVKPKVSPGGLGRDGGKLTLCRLLGVWNGVPRVLQEFHA
jgi:hypothetical protein